jgi:hypothetical protein
MNAQCTIWHKFRVKRHADFQRKLSTLPSGKMRGVLTMKANIWSSKNSKRNMSTPIMMGTNARDSIKCEASRVPT